MSPRRASLGRQAVPVPGNIMAPGPTSTRPSWSPLATPRARRP